MIRRLNNSGTEANAAQIKNSADVPLEIMRRGLARTAPVRVGEHLFNSKYLEAYSERRKKLTARIREEHPTFTDSEIEERLEQFGA
jgi:hypothetical protein